MRKLFVVGGASSPAYAEELSAGLAAVEAATGDVCAVALDALSVDDLVQRGIDVVVSNGLPEQWYDILRGLHIVSVTFDVLDRFVSLADVIIDCKSGASNKYFTGPAYSLQANALFQKEFCEIVDLVRKLEWDSAFWGVNVGYLSCRYLTTAIITRVERLMEEQRIDVVEYLCNCHDDRSVTIAEKNGFHFTDIRLSYDRRLGREGGSDHCEPLPIGVVFDHARNEDVPWLKALASNLYLDSRYFFDGHFDRDRANIFYQTWVEKGVLGTYDDICFCLREQGVPISFCTVKYHDSKTAQIGLVGIAVPYQGKGLGVHMLQYAIADLAKRGYESVSVVTQGRNYGAQRLYQKVGFKTKAVELWYHKWK